MADKTIPLTQEYIKSILDYNPETGIFTWKWREFTNPRCNGWNTKYADKPAGRNSTKKRHSLEIGINGALYCSHRLAWLWMTGTWPKQEIDHRDNNPMNNKWENLREATHAQNMLNRKLEERNKIGLKGVSIRKDGYIRARINIGRKNIHLGYFKTAEEAHKAYCDASKKYHGEFGRVK